MGRLSRYGIRSRMSAAVFAAGTLVTAAVLATAGPAAGAPGSGSPAVETASRAGVTVVGDFNLATVDPGSPSEATGSGSIYYYAIYDGLFTFSPSSQLRPELATSWSFARGGKVANITLRKGVKFQDGTPLNAAAVQWNLQRDGDPSNACACLQSFTDVASVAAPSPNVVRVTLKHADPSFFTVLASSSGNFVASPTAYRKEGAAAFGLKPVGAGPFAVESLVADSKLVLTPFPGYWDARDIHLGGVTVLVDPQPASQYDALTAGSAQLMMFADPTTEQQAVKDHRYQVITQPATSWSAIEFNTTAPPFDSLAARKAVAAALDPDALNKTIYYGTNVVSDSIFGKGEDLAIGANVPGGATMNQPATAQSLVKQLPPISFTMNSLDSPTNRQVLTAIETELNQVGIKMQISTYPRSSYLPVLEGGHYQAFFAGDSGQIDPSAYAGAFFVSGGEFQKNLKDPTLDSMVAAAEATTSKSGRIAAYRKIMSYVDRQVYFIPLWTTPTLDVAVSSLKGLVVGPSLNLNHAYLAGSGSGAS